MMIIRIADRPSPPGISWKPLAMALCLAGGAWSQGDPGSKDDLQDFRTLATSLVKKGAGKDTGVVLEYEESRWSNECTRHQPEMGLRLLGDGRISVLVTRSFAESHRNGPGSFRGRMAAGDWNSLLAPIARMKWVKSASLPMPGMSETHFAIRIRKGGKTAEFSFTGSVPPGQNLISGGLHAASDLVRIGKSDTLWSLTLRASAAGIQAGEIAVRSTWSNHGSQAIRIRLPLEGASPACGTTGLRWFTALTGERSHLPEIQTSALGKRPAEPGAWKLLRPGDSIASELTYSLPKPPDGRKRGAISHLGFPVALEGAADTLATLSLFSDYFDFGEP